MKIALYALALFSFTAYSSPNNYIYPIQDPTFSNYGTLGLLQNPTARFHEEGTIAFAWNRMNPYLRGSIIAYPFDWFEASFQYADINNRLYSNVSAFSGSQSAKDKGFDAKFRLFSESRLMPQIALGFRDMGGTGLFSSEYVVLSKFINNIDISFGLGWGTLSGTSNENLLGFLSDKFKERPGYTQAKGGELSLNNFFRGKMGVFGGAEIFLPYLKGSRLKIEYDGIDYDLEGFPPIRQTEKINFGFTYPLSSSFHLKIGYVRGNTFNIGFSYAGNYGKKKSIIKKNDPYIPVENSEIVKRVTSREERLFYLASLSYLRDRQLYLQAADINEEKNKFTVVYTQSKYMSHTRSIGRLSRVLDEISPNNIKEFEIINMNAGQAVFLAKVNRDRFNHYDPNPIKGLTLEEADLDGYKLDYNDFSFVPEPELPKYIFKFAPDVRTQIGGPDGFFFGDLRLAFKSETLISRNFNLNIRASAGIYDNMNELKLPSDSVLPHVRTDIVQYLKQSRAFALERMHFNYFSNPFHKDFYTKFSFGLFESMFGGAGGEVLYRPFFKDWALGVEAWRVRQRAYKQNFDFLDYETSTGFVNFYYFQPSLKILTKIKGGKFLAGDSGFKFDFSRQFRNGTSMGIFFSLTDISKEEFGEGSFDKGFYFHIPIETFFTSYSRGFTGFGLRPVTRDGAATLNQAFTLWGISDQGNKHTILRNWDDIYD